MRLSNRTPNPLAPSGTVGMCDGLRQATPAMSRCAQGVPLTNFCRIRAAVIEPAGRPPTFYMSAMGESNCFS